MKKLLYLFVTVSFLFSCSSGGGGGDTNPDISGCMDDCAVNYNEDANLDDGSCLYAFEGTYLTNNYDINGVSYFNSNVAEMVVHFSLDGTFIITEFYDDLTYASFTGAYVNTLTTVTLTYDDPNMEVQTWIIENINCSEFDGASVDGGGNDYYIELDYIGDAWNPPFDISGCMDPCAVNYDPNATIDEGVCYYEFIGTYVVNEYTENGISLFTSEFGAGGDPYLIEAVVHFEPLTNFTDYIGTCDFVAYLSDGTIEHNPSTYIATGSTMTIIPDDAMEPTQDWIVENINCTEFDGSSLDGAGNEYYIELDYMGDWIAPW